MPYHLKHSIAIALALGVAVVFGMNLNSQHDVPLAFTPPNQVTQRQSVGDERLDRIPKPDSHVGDHVARLQTPGSDSAARTEFQRAASDASQWNSQWDLGVPAEDTVDEPRASSVEWKSNRDDEGAASLEVVHSVAERTVVASGGSTDDFTDDFEFEFPEDPSVPLADDSPRLDRNASSDWQNDQVSEVVSGLSPPAASTTGMLEWSDARGPESAFTPASESVPDSITLNAQVLASNRPPQIENSTPVTVQLLESSAIQAIHHIEYGKSLSRRGASFAARQEFLSALGVIAEANDIQTNGTSFSQALMRAIIVMKEAEDLVVRDVESQISMDIASVTESHRSGVLSETQVMTMTPKQARHQYFVAALHQFDLAGGRNVVTAEALHCLGKLHTMRLKTRTIPSELDLEKAIVFHQAALLSDVSNFRSSNELGVLMAQSGQLEEAKRLFRQSLVVKEMPQTWSNLAEAHRRLGESRRAQQADDEVMRLAQAPSRNSSASIRWLPASEFARSSGAVPDRMASQTHPVVANPLPRVSEPNSSHSLSGSIGARLREWF